MAAVRIGAEDDVVFGTTDETWGFISNMTKTTEVDEVELLDGDSDVRAVEQIKKRTTISGEYIFRATGGPDATAVGTGTPITIDSVAYYIKSAEVTDSSGDFQKIRFTGTNWPTLSV